VGIVSRCATAVERRAPRSSAALPASTSSPASMRRPTTT